ncbi:hypothetical protein CISIN_1g026018mg [Citrus sinensis]|uniref:Uncharacterized protein n=1 Tax=Citrus sinensis TaxID=2711 RepID=A0A067DK03_CITSI|nr:hypothetical protein CISIN_1g026018mg [Citrus sinensis]
MYPKVKVREEKYQYDEHVAVGLQLLESLSLHVPSSPEIEHRDDSRAFIARIPKSPLRNVVTPTNSTHKEAEQNNYTKIDEKEKPNIRVTSPTMDSTSLSDDGKNDVKIDEKEKPNIRVTSPTMDSTSLSDDGKNDVKIDETEKPNIRAGSILRPRAVLSSPDNDAVIGNKNRLKGERPAALRNHDMVSNRHAKAKCKASPTHIKSQLNTTSSNNVHENKSDNKGKKGSATADPSQRRYLRTWKF